MSESFAMGESALQGMRETGSRTGETVFRYPATRVIPPGRHDFHLGIDRGERRLDWRTKCLHPSTNGRRWGNIMALDLHRMGALGQIGRWRRNYLSLRVYSAAECWSACPCSPSPARSPACCWAKRSPSRSRRFAVVLAPPPTHSKIGRAHV